MWGATLYSCYAPLKSRVPASSPSRYLEREVKGNLTCPFPLSDFPSNLTLWPSRTNAVHLLMALELKEMVKGGVICS